MIKTTYHHPPQHQVLALQCPGILVHWMWCCEVLRRGMVTECHQLNPISEGCSILWSSITADPRWNSLCFLTQYSVSCLVLIGMCASSTSLQVLGSANHDAACLGGRLCRAMLTVWGSVWKLDRGPEGKVGLELGRLLSSLCICSLQRLTYIIDCVFLLIDLLPGLVL